MKKNHNDPTYYVGYRYINRQGYPAEIVAYRHNKSIDIKFDDCDTVLTTKGTYIKNGQPLHPVHGKPQVGDKFPCKDGDTVEIVEYVSILDTTTQLRKPTMPTGLPKLTLLYNLHTSGKVRLMIG